MEMVSNPALAHFETDRSVRSVGIHFELE